MGLCDFSRCDDARSLIDWIYAGAWFARMIDPPDRLTVRPNLRGYDAEWCGALTAGRSHLLQENVRFAPNRRHDSRTRHACSVQEHTKCVAAKKVADETTRLLLLREKRYGIISWRFILSRVCSQPLL